MDSEHNEEVLETPSATAQKGMSRRDFVWRTTTAGMASVVGLAATGIVGCTPSGKGDATDANSDAAIIKTPDETLDADVVIVGSGVAGLAAAIRAAEEGSSVILLEKESIIGGSSNHAEGIFGIDSPLQKELGVTVGVKEILQTEFAFQHHMVNTKLWEQVAEKASENITWFMEKGAKFETVLAVTPGGVPTFHLYEHGHGSEAMEALAATAKGLGVKIMTSTPGTHLLVENGTVVGIQAEGSGKVINIDAKAIVLATGSAGGNGDMVNALSSRTYNKYVWS
ncbi:MAG: FAD-dependent oxidoreductase [Coriobacteriia bacterium]